MAPLVWVPWVPRNPSNFEQWVPKPISSGKKELNSTFFSAPRNWGWESGNFIHLGTHQFEYLTEPLIGYLDRLLLTKHNVDGRRFEIK